MKVSKTAWLILGIGIFVIAFATLFMLHSQQSGEQEWLEDSLSAAQAALPQLISEREDLGNQLTQLESQLTQATSSLSSSKARFPKSVQSIEYDEALFDIAKACDLEIVKLTASEPSAEEVEDVTYAITSFEVTVRAAKSPPHSMTEAYIDKTVANILDFINTIATDGYFTNATIELVNMEAPEPGEEEAESPEATIKLVIYGYKGE